MARTALLHRDEEIVCQDIRVPTSGDQFGSLGARVTANEATLTATAAAKQQAVVATSLTAITAQTTLQTLTGLGVAIGTSATERWLVRYTLLISTANADMDIKLGVTVPASTTARWGSGEGVAAGAAPVLLADQTGTVVLGSGIGVVGAFITAVVLGGATAGTFQIKYAQNTSDAGELQVLAGSCMEATRLAA